MRVFIVASVAVSVILVAMEPAPTTPVEKCRAACYNPYFGFLESNYPLYVLGENSRGSCEEVCK